jgi:hypothetical protein
MPMTTAATSAAYIGRCPHCRTTYRASVRGVFCDCRAGVVCTGVRRCELHHRETGIVDHPSAAVPMAPIAATASDAACDLRCVEASSAKCACSCLGSNHGLHHSVAGT